MKVSLIGPTNLLNLGKHISKPISFLKSRSAVIGREIAKTGADLLINSDKGMIMDTALAYKKNKGNNLTILFPEKGEPWPNNHAKVFAKHADFLDKQENWFWTNYNGVSLPDVCVCSGLSAGTFCELAYIKWNIQFKKGKLKKLVVIKELIRNEKLPVEFETEFGSILVYVDRAEDLEELFINYQKKKKPKK